MDDTVVEVLETCKSPSEALKSSPNVLFHSLCCAVCRTLMLEPYTLTCGHSFCSDCLRAWSQRAKRGKPPTCPSCRRQYTSEPVICLALRELALAAVASYGASHPEVEIDADLLGLKQKQNFLKPVVLPPKYDADDDVYRCNDCGHEVEEDGYCSGCNKFYPTMVDELSSEDEGPSNNAEQSRNDIFPACNDPWLPSPRLEESLEDVWTQFSQFLTEVRKNDDYLNGIKNSAPMETTYTEPSDSQEMESGRFLLLNWRWWDWLRRWRLLIDDGADFDPFLEGGKTTLSIKRCFFRFLDTIREGGSFDALVESLHLPDAVQRVKMWESLYGKKIANEEDVNDDNNDNDAVDLVDDEALESDGDEDEDESADSLGEEDDIVGGLIDDEEEEEEDEDIDNSLADFVENDEEEDEEDREVHLSHSELESESQSELEHTSQPIEIIDSESDSDFSVMTLKRKRAISDSE